MALKDLEAKFEEWFISGGEESPAIQITKIGLELRKEVPNDPASLDAAISWRCVALAYVNEKYAEAKVFHTAAYAYALEELCQTFDGNTLRDVAKGKVIDFLRALESLDRQRATLTHTLDGLRSRLSNAKEERSHTRFMR